jgi:broad specificity phosphatase PhoE
VHPMRLLYSGRVKRTAARLIVLLLLCGAQPILAQDAVFIVRHAERADTSADSPLSAAGEARATRLAALLKDAGITQIYTTDLTRTIQTGAPLARALHLTATALKAGDQETLLARLHAASLHDRILVVGHSNTVPALLQALGVTTPMTLDDAEYDNLFLVVPQPGAPPRLFRFRF